MYAMIIDRPDRLIRKLAQKSRRDSANLTRDSRARIIAQETRERRGK